MVSEAQKISRKKYYLANREKLLAYTRNWVACNREHHNSIVRRWQKANPDKIKGSHIRNHWNKEVLLVPNYDDDVKKALLEGGKGLEAMMIKRGILNHDSNKEESIVQM